MSIAYLSDYIFLKSCDNQATKYRSQYHEMNALLGPSIQQSRLHNLLSLQVLGKLFNPPEIYCLRL